VESSISVNTNVSVGLTGAIVPYGTTDVTGLGLRIGTISGLGCMRRLLTRVTNPG